ncbi:hypothetical protein GH984_05835 [Spiribacter sp. C176]|uniref:histidine kinase n=1 Tax=Spiribacter salilacus TaxID=2664894 RepID=A0A6N7QPB2_9GAMM|nr:ATP-binding protein [Spiribacter salilacus]MRH78221.1 hypothetical protein [Spiribacter salilacus]
MNTVLALDPLTLMAVLACSMIFFGTLVTVLGRKGSAVLPGWGIGSALAGVGLILLILRPLIPAFWSILVGNSVILVGMALMLNALASHLQYRYAKQISIAWFGLTAGSFTLVWLSPWGELVWLRVLIVSAAVVFQQTFCAYLVLKLRSRQSLVSYVFLSTVLFVALLFFVRTVESLLYLSEQQFLAGMGAALFMLGLVVFGYLQSPAFLFLIYEDGLRKSQQMELALVTQAAEQEAERARVEERIREKRNETIKHIAYGFGHDMANALGLLQGTFGQLATQLDTSDVTTRYSLRQCEHAMQLARNTVTGVSALSSSESIQTGPVDINYLMDEFLSLLRQQLREGVELQTRIEPELTAITHPGLFLSALTNLTKNAQNAMVNGGQLTVSAEWCSQMPATSPAVGMVLFGPVIMIRVTDTGCGMDWQTQQRIFEPLFSNSDNPQGSGLGLFMVRCFIERSGAALLLRSAPGEGTTTSLIFPAESRASEQTNG